MNASPAPSPSTGPAITFGRFESRRAPLASRRHFLRRLLGHALVGCGVLAALLFLGMCGFHFLEQLRWLDAYLNAAMLLSGMGPLAAPQTDAGKVFAGLYALFSGVAFLTAMGIFLGPVVHRFLHRFHLESLKSE
jgi:hypothetical protein